MANGRRQDRFPDKEFDDTMAMPSPPSTPARYFEDYARDRSLPVGPKKKCCRQPRIGRVPVPDRDKQGPLSGQQYCGGDRRVSGALVPVVPESAAVTQLHSKFYRNPEQLAPARAGRRCRLGCADCRRTQPRRARGLSVRWSARAAAAPYRGEDYRHWLGLLGKWEMKTPPPAPNVTISVSGAFGGYTVDFREYAAQGMNLVGMLEGDGATLTFADDLADNIRAGDENYLGLLDEVDDFISERGSTRQRMRLRATSRPTRCA